jgi:cytochrome P450
MLLLSVLYALLSAYLIWSVVTFIQNYSKARKIGLPTLISPIGPNNPIWMIFKDRLIPLFSKLPFGLGEWAPRAEIGWTYYDKYAVHARYGQAFTIATPSGIDIVLAEPTAVEDVMRRRNDFIKDPNIYGMLDFYGPNLDTVNGKQWDRHRKITVPPFNEQNSALVWRETADQAEQILQTWSSKDCVMTTQYDVHAVALNVLCGAGFGVQSSFVDDTTSVDNGGKQRLGYRESLRLLLANIVQLVLLTILMKAGIPKWMFVGKMATVGQAYDELKEYMSQMLQKEKAAFEQGDLTRHNLMSALVRASEESRGDDSIADDPKERSSGGLTDDEVYGNLFIYNLAGHVSNAHLVMNHLRPLTLCKDTTAATLHFAITLLAVYPEWQGWLAQEINEVRRSEKSEIYYYEQTFPKLRRCLALMVGSI